MGLEEDLAEIVTSNQAKREADRLSLKHLDEDWETARETVIRPRLEIAASSLNRSGPRLWEVKRDNGGIDLIFKDLARNISTTEESYYGPISKLSFSKDTDTRKIACESSEENINEDFDVSKVTPGEVDRKIKEFVRVVT
jgi:hypothetical protein